MIEYLLLFPDAATRDAAYPAPEGTPPSWAVGEATVMPVSVVLVEATFDVQGNEVTPEVRPGGSWMRLRSVTRLPDVEALPNCLLATDSSLALQRLPFVIFSRFQPETLIGRITPMFVGDEYRIPVGQPASALDEWLISPA